MRVDLKVEWTMCMLDFLLIELFHTNRSFLYVVSANEVW